MTKCNNCDQHKPIVNKKYNLCDDCNFARLHQGKTRGEVYKERADKKFAEQITSDSVKKFGIRLRPSLKINSKPKAVKQQTEKQKIRQTLLSQLKREIEEKAVQENKYYCWGCGTSGIGLDKSHILSVKHRKDLELEEKNINLFCRKCHSDWESGDILRMLNLNSFEEDLMFIKQNDSGRYNKIFDTIEYLLIHRELYSNYSQQLEKAEKIYNENDFIPL